MLDSKCLFVFILDCAEAVYRLKADLEPESSRSREAFEGVCGWLDLSGFKAGAVELRCLHAPGKLGLREARARPGPDQNARQLKLFVQRIVFRPSISDLSSSPDAGLLLWSCFESCRARSPKND